MLCTQTRNRNQVADAWQYRPILVNTRNRELWPERKVRPCPVEIWHWFDGEGGKNFSRVCLCFPFFSEKQNRFSRDDSSINTSWFHAKTKSTRTTTNKVDGQLPQKKCVAIEWIRHKARQWRTNSTQGSGRLALWVTGRERWYWSSRSYTVVFLNSSLD